MAWTDVDHSYTQHWSDQCLWDKSTSLPLKDLFTKSECNDNSGIENVASASSLSYHSSEEEIDVEEIDDFHATIGSKSWHCSEQKARMQMNECERHAASSVNSLDDDLESTWEERINKVQWNKDEVKIFDKAKEILLNERLARLTYKGTSNEIVLRRLSVDHSASQLRWLLASFEWDSKLTSWLHVQLVDNLPAILLAYYQDIVQTLRSQVPTLTERMIMPSKDATGPASDSLGILLKRPWDPAVTAVISNSKPKANPYLFIIVPYTFGQSMIQFASRRLRFWNSLLGQIGKVVSITGLSSDDAIHSKSAETTVEEITVKMLQLICKKISELRTRHTSRKIVLVGWHTSSLFNTYVSLLEDIYAVINLGFPLYNALQQQGSVDDILCEVTTPTLFVVGDSATSCRVEDIEDCCTNTFTEALTQTIVVPAANDWLRVTRKARKKFSLTQSMVDRKILEHISEFLDQVNHYLKKRDSRASIHSKRRHSSTIDGMTSFSSIKSAYRPDLGSKSVGGHPWKDNTNFKNLEGVPYDIQAGSINNSTSNEVFLKRTNAARSLRHSHDNARSITIDLTKDPGSQVTNSSVRRKSQVILPTKDQTEAAVAAILGKRKSNETSSNTTDDSPRIHSAAKRSSPSTSKFLSHPLLTNANEEHTQKLNNSNKKITVPHRLKSTDQPYVHSQSFTSRSRNEDRETQQATAFLEQLSNPPGYKSSATKTIKPSQKADLNNRNYHGATYTKGKKAALTKTKIVQKSDASASLPTSSFVRYVVSSSGLKRVALTGISEKRNSSNVSSSVTNKPSAVIRSIQTTKCSPVMTRAPPKLSSCQSFADTVFGTPSKSPGVKTNRSVQLKSLSAISTNSVKTFKKISSVKHPVGSPSPHLSVQTSTAFVIDSRPVGIASSSVSSFVGTAVTSSNVSIQKQPSTLASYQQSKSKEVLTHDDAKTNLSNVADTACSTLASSSSNTASALQPSVVLTKLQPSETVDK